MTRAVASNPSRRRIRAGIPSLTLLLAGAAAARAARIRRRVRPAGHAVPAARRAVLLINPRSGGGKAQRLGLVGQCRARGIEPVVLQPGDDLAALAEAAVTRGADVVGMAGGDGSQGVVAGVAARHGVAMVVVPAGTRNHLAMDLGLDRGNVIGALDAFGTARERTIDLGQVNGRVFVNNVSLGLYAEIIRSPDYRDAKVETTLSALPHLLGPGSRPFDLRFTGPVGEQHTAAHVVQVSNNPYGRTPGSLASRPRLDGGQLGVVALELPDPAAREFLAAAAAGWPERVPGLIAWEAPTFTVDSGGPIDLGIDGETLRMTPPLAFTIRPGALRIRLPQHALGLSPAARELRAHSTLRGLRAAFLRCAELGKLLAMQSTTVPRR
ncbi:MAG TPA: diacylglycerol kinase family protein [Pseudonocardiaceae bacterium]|nr:diacylglycerol kinase family protein [Pseudonocardiaceae bacterium]